jgi:hypothetical protein
MYARTQENGHDVWKERWYAFMLRVSLHIDFYMIREDQVVVADVLVTNLTQKIMVSNVIS